jgi:hypothetical protein
MKAKIVQVYMKKLSSMKQMMMTTMTQTLSITFIFTIVEIFQVFDFQLFQGR